MINCPYCSIKKIAKLKTKYNACDPKEGTCECGAYIDGGQMSVEVNGYKDVYDGVIKLIDKLVEEFNYILDYMDVDVEEYFDDEAVISLSSAEIIEKLFLPYAGGTTKRNFINALDIKDDEHEWKIHRDMHIF